MPLNTQAQLIEQLLTARFAAGEALVMDDDHSLFQVDENQVIASMGLSHPFANWVWQSDQKEPNAQQVDRTIKLFKERQLPFIWWGKYPILEQKGLIFAGTLQGIAVALDPFDGSASFIPPGLFIHEAALPEELETFAALCCKTNEIASDQVPRAAKLFESGRKRGSCSHFIGYMEGVPVACLTLVHARGVAGLWNGGTLEAYRQQGIGQAMVAHAMQVAKEKGFSHAFAFLAPAGLAQGICNRLGFQPLQSVDVCVYA